MAEEWIDKQSLEYQEGKSIQFGCYRQKQGVSSWGRFGLNNIFPGISKRRNWGIGLVKHIGVRVYCTEAASSVLKWGFESTGIEPD